MLLQTKNFNFEKKEKGLGAPDLGPLEENGAAPAKSKVNIGLNS